MVARIRLTPVHEDALQTALGEIGLRHLFGDIGEAKPRQCDVQHWVQGRNVVIEYRWAEGNEERYDEIAAEFVRLNVDVIVTSGGAVLAIKQATSTIPIVFAVAVDPLGGGLVKSLARPGGNATGLSSQSTDLAGKRLEILREIVPGLHQVAALGNVTYGAAQIELREIEELAHKLGFTAEVLEVRRSEEIAPAFAVMRSSPASAYGRSVCCRTPPRTTL